LYIELDINFCLLYSHFLHQMCLEVEERKLFDRYLAAVDVIHSTVNIVLPAASNKQNFIGHVVEDTDLSNVTSFNVRMIQPLTSFV